MIFKYRILAAIILSASFIQSCSGSDKQGGIAALPGLFEPLTWNITRDKLPVALGKPKLTSSKYRDAEGRLLTSFIATVVQNGILDKSLLTVTYGDEDRPLSIEFMKFQEINNCVNQIGDREKCYQLEFKKSQSLLTTIKLDLEKSLGKAEAYSGSYRESMGLPAHKDEKGYLWEEQGYKLFLTLTLDEEDIWSISVYAVRRK